MLNQVDGNGPMAMRRPCTAYLYALENRSFFCSELSQLSQGPSIIRNATYHSRRSVNDLASCRYVQYCSTVVPISVVQYSSRSNKRQLLDNLDLV